MDCSSLEVASVSQRERSHLRGLNAALDWLYIVHRAFHFRILSLFHDSPAESQLKSSCNQFHPDRFSLLFASWNFSVLFLLRFTRRVFFRSSSIDSTLWKKKKKKRSDKRAARDVCLTNGMEKKGTRETCLQGLRENSERVVSSSSTVNAHLSLAQDLRDFSHRGLEYQLVANRLLGASTMNSNVDPLEKRTEILFQCPWREVSFVVFLFFSFPTSNNQIFPLLASWLENCEKKNHTIVLGGKKMRSNACITTEGFWGTFVIHRAAMRIDRYKADEGNKSLFDE